MSLDTIVDEQLRRATRAGAFDNLRGTGRPLRLYENPYADPSVRMAHHLLRNNGCTLPWIAERQEIDLAVEQSRERLLLAARSYHTDERAQTVQQQAADVFRQEAAALNRRILSYNLRVPSSLVQRDPIDIAWELTRAFQVQPVPVVVPAPVVPPNLVEATPQSGYRDLLITYLLPQWRRVLLLAFLLLGSIGLELTNPQIVRSFIDTARSGGATDLLLRAALLYVAAVCGGQLLGAGATYLGTDLGWTATNALRSDLLLHCLQLDLRFHQERTPGELIERVDGDVGLLANFFAQFVVHIVGNAILLVGVLALLFRENWQVGLALLIYVGLTLGVLRRLQGIAVPSIKAMRQISAELTAFWEERLLGTEDIRASGAQPYVLARHGRLMRTLLERGRMSVVMFRVYAGTWEVLFALGNAIVFALGAYLLHGGTLTLGAVYLIFAYTGLLSLHLGRITDQLNELQNAAAGISRINELRLARSLVVDGPGVALPAGPLAVAFEHVSFGYVRPGEEGDKETRRQGDGETGEDVDHGDSSATLRSPSPPRRFGLHDISFQLKPGEILGLLGHTGSGKSTLVRLVFRFYDPDQGTILLGDADIRRATLPALRGRIGMVTQEVQLFGGTLRDNLTLFDETIPDEHIMHAIDALGLREWYERLPMGLDTELAGGGSGLSAGEAQLLAFTRVLLQDPGLVILDEASSRLDPASERLIERALDRLLADRTAIIIAHRLDTLARADTIMMLDTGQVVEYGLRSQLASDAHSRFARLLATGDRQLEAEDT